MKAGLYEPLMYQGSRLWYVLSISE